MKNDPLDLLRELGEEEFQGKTRFRLLSPSEKLRWLAQAARFVAEARKIREEAEDSTSSRN